MVRSACLSPWDINKRSHCCYHCIQLLPKLPPFCGSLKQLPWDPRLGFSEAVMSKEPPLRAGALLRSAGPPPQAPSDSTLESHEHQHQSFYHRSPVPASESFCGEGVTEAWRLPSLLTGVQGKNRSAIWHPVYARNSRGSHLCIPGSDT